MINLVVASSYEARPIIDHYQLKNISAGQAFSHYAGEELHLIISGIGKINAAAATAYLQALTHNEKPRAWLNVGIAGHGSLDLGDAFIAHSIMDTATARAHYPPLSLKLELPSSDLHTVDEPKTHYQPGCGYDMEASAFYSIATRTCTAELVHCYKIVSDNPGHPINEHSVFDKLHIDTLIRPHLKPLDQLIRTLSKNCDQYNAAGVANPHYDDIIHRIRFTVSQKSQLHRLLQRYQILFSQALPATMDLSSYQRAKPLLADLHSALADHQMDY